MRIKRLIMHNFGVYAGTNGLEFKGNKPVILIGGMNGRGKTTILEAVLLGLYGSNSFAYTESKYTTYGQYLKSYVNRADGSLESYVEIEFSMDDFEEEVYCVHREWDGNSQRVREKIRVRKNGEENTFLTDNWAMFVENILPSALSSFFFFDGEKIAELAVEETSEQMKESVKAMLGITVLDILQGDIGRIISRISKENNGNQDLKRLEELRIVKEEAEKALGKADERLQTLNLEMQELQLNLEKLNVEYSVKGGGILEQKNMLLKQRAESIAAVASCQEQLIELVAGEMPLLLVSELLRDIQNQSQIEHERKLNRMALDKIKSTYGKFSEKSDQITGFIEFMQKEMSASKEEDVYRLSDLNLFQIDALNIDGLQRCGDKAKSLISKRNNYQKNVDDIDNSLSVDIDEKSLKDLFNAIRNKEREITKKQIEIDILEKERTSLHGTQVIAESEFGKYAEGILSVLESVDSNERTVKYAHMAIEIIKLYRVRLQERKTNVLAQTMTECYKKLANKKKLVDYIKMDSESLDLHYMNNEGVEIAKKRLSAGEKQLMVISLLWALAICSKKKLPVIIDTPLSRLDSSHRQALIKIYFPKASDQTIILSTDSEIDENYYSLMKNSVGDEFTLKYNDETKNTTITPGYFGWGGSES
ncbi:DNA sulfur modification protein DndD [Anaerocolumna sp. AGMB13025]|uniref:DNA sulfur modification protein DndD n=1 Tax=Anaerocolumna sp. AGMB13025 TaxID=3039116 RepID=UPI00241D017F|nr:DNA sulfur modification protein DndD [Anaerocolumna sp. AGMB13025]WFR58134.1 DNA sulfur modification protein DndD [Anaerocolumna sp. AGMB13025]